MENEFSAEQAVVTTEADPAEADQTLWVMRSVAVLGVIAGTAGTVVVPFGMTRFHQGAMNGSLEIGLFVQPAVSPSMDAIWLFVSSLTGTGLAGLLLAGSLGALRFRHWARPTLLLWSICSLLLSAVGSYFYLRWLFSPHRAELSEVRGVVDLLSNFAGFGVGTPLAIVMLILLMQESVKSAFAVNGHVIFRRSATLPPLTNT